MFKANTIGSNIEYGQLKPSPFNPRNIVRIEDKVSIESLFHPDINGIVIKESPNSIPLLFGQGENGDYVGDELILKRYKDEGSRLNSLLKIASSKITEGIYRDIKNANKKWQVEGLSISFSDLQIKVLCRSLNEIASENFKLFAKPLCDFTSGRITEDGIVLSQLELIESKDI